MQKLTWPMAYMGSFLSCHWIHTKVVIKNQIVYVPLLANICILMVGSFSLYAVYPSPDSTEITFKHYIKFLWNIFKILSKFIFLERGSPCSSEP